MKAAVVHRDVKPANVSQPRAIATVRHVDDVDRLRILLDILGTALDERRRSGQQG